MNDARGAATGEAGTVLPPPTAEDPPGGASDDARPGVDERVPEGALPEASGPLAEPVHRAPDDPGPLDDPGPSPQPSQDSSAAEPEAAASGHAHLLELPPIDRPAEPTPEAPTLDASVHAHVLEDPLPAPGLVDTAETPLFADTFPKYASLSRPAGEVAGGPPADPRSRQADPYPLAPSFAAAIAATPDDGGGSERHTHVGAARIPLRRRRAFRRTLATLLVLVLLALGGLATYLFRSAQAWRDRAGSYLDTSLEIGDELAGTRGQLAGSQAELEAVRAQLATTHQRIVELADEKNQALDDWEITQQLVDYQQRVSDAAGEVALALDHCVQGQQELIGYLQASAEPGGPVYDPVVLAQFETDVEALCQAASEANIGLQRELAR